MASNDKVIINKFINTLWQWIKNMEYPPQTDNEAWVCLINSADKLIKDFEKQYIINDELRHMFTQWANDVLEYVGKESIKEGKLIEGNKTDR